MPPSSCFGEVSPYLDNTEAMRAAPNPRSLGRGNERIINMTWNHCASAASAKIFAIIGSKDTSEMCFCPDLGVRRAPLAPPPRYAPARGAKYLNESETWTGGS